MTPDTMASAGLRIGQRDKLFVPGTKGSGWYDKKGSWFGWGDLSRENMISIAQALPENELFIVLHEEDAFRRFLRHIVPDISRVRRSEDAPGFDYVVDNALFVIAKDQICRVDNIYPHKQRDDEQDKFAVRFLCTETVRAMILACNVVKQAALVA